MLITIVLEKNALLSPDVTVGPTAPSAGEDENCAKLH